MIYEDPSTSEVVLVLYVFSPMLPACALRKPCWRGFSLDWEKDVVVFEMESLWVALAGLKHVM